MGSDKNFPPTKIPYRKDSVSNRFVYFYIPKQHRVSFTLIHITPMFELSNFENLEIIMEKKNH